MKDKDKRKQLRTDLYERLEDGERIPIAIKDLRRILSLDQESFSKLVGIGVSTLRKIEQTNSNFSITALQKVLDKFDLEIVIRKKTK